MDFLYDYNALPFYTEEDIMLRAHFTESLQFRLKQILISTNPAWTMERIEAPCLIPRDMISQNYTNDDLWVQEEPDPNRKTLVLKPETTPSTYAWMRRQLRNRTKKPPMCVWQLSKSFRREQDQPTKHCRFKEFYQHEFQCLFTKDSMNDYFSVVAPQMAQVFMELVNCPTRLVVADRLPDYSEKTWDVEVWNNDKWMEVCSMSLRNDFPDKFQLKNKEVECSVFEIATSPDRLTYCYKERLKVSNLLLEISEEIKDK